MSTLYFINCYTGTPILDIGVCNLKNGHIIFAEIDNREISTSQTDSIYQAKIVISPEFRFYDLIQNDVNMQYGFRYQTSDVNIAFVIRDKKLLANGQMELKLKSSIDILNESTSNPDFVSSNVLVSTVLATLDPRFIYTLISLDRNVILTTDLKNDYNVLKNIIEYADNWSFRENGLVSQGTGIWKTEIIIGNMQNDIEAYYNANPALRTESKPIRVTSNRKFSNPDDIDQVVAQDIEVNYASATPNRVYVFGDNNQGLTLNSRSSLNGSIITRNDFPVSSVIKSNGRRYWFINNINAPQGVIREKVLTYVNSTNELDVSNNSVIGENISPQKLYQFGCSYIQGLKYLPTIKIPVSMVRKFTLPGNIVYLKVKKTYEKQDGTYKTIVDYEGKYFNKQADAVDLSIIKN